jgi:hypothetical protein
LKDIVEFINRYFSLNMNGVSSENKLNDIFQECIDKKKMWVLLEKNLGTTCIKLPDASADVDTYLLGPQTNKYVSTSALASGSFIQVVPKFFSSNTHIFFLSIHS